MRKKINDVENNKPQATKLVISGAEEKLEQRVNLGKELNTKQISNQQEFELLKKNYKAWNNYNKELLKKIFSTTEISDEYAQYQTRPMVMRGYGSVYTWHDDFQDLTQDLIDKIDKLEDIVGRLELYKSSTGSIKDAQAEERYKILSEELEYRERIKDERAYKCFVIMPIGDEGTIEYENNIAVFKNIIKPCVENSGYNIKCYHADLIKRSGGITKQIIEALKNDHVVIADLRRNNPNVTYELGIRHVFNKRSILVCSKQSDNIFHTKNYRAIEYKIDGTSNQDFYNSLVLYIDDIISNPEKSDNPVTDSLGIEISPIGGHSTKKRFYISRINKQGYSLAEIYNQSDHDIIDLDITLEYVDKAGAEQKNQAEIIDSSGDLIYARPYTCKLITKKEKKWIYNLPRKETKIIIAGKEADTGEQFEEIFEMAEKK